MSEPKTQACRKLTRSQNGRNVLGMTKKEAAETIALDVRVWCRRTNRTPDRAIVEERMSELRGGYYAGTLKHRAAWACNWKTTLRLALQDWGK
jgi:hypothetical protein